MQIMNKATITTRRGGTVTVEYSVTQLKSGRWTTYMTYRGLSVQGGGNNRQEAVTVARTKLLQAIG